MKDATPLKPPRVHESGIVFTNVNDIQSMVPEYQKNKTTQ